MSDEIDFVREAAEFLDKWSSDLEFLENWRERIDIDTLDMSDFRKCILGQLHPSHYDNAREALRGLRGWERLKAAFDGTTSTRPWKEYLQGWNINVNLTYVQKCGEMKTKSIRTMEIDGTSYVVFLYEGYDEAILQKMDYFLEMHKEYKPCSFRPGDVLVSEEGLLFLFKSENAVVRLGSKSLDFCTYEWYAKRYKLKKCDLYQGLSYFGDLFDK